MLYENNILNTKTLDLNSRGMVVSMANGAAIVASFQNVLVGAVQRLLLKVKKMGKFLFMAFLNGINYCFFPVVYNLSSSTIIEENTKINKAYIEYTHELFRILIFISCVYCLIRCVILILDNVSNKPRNLNRWLKSLIFVVLTCSVFVVTSAHLFYDVKIGFINFSNSTYLNTIFISIIVAIPFLFFILTVFFTSYNIKLALNNNYSIYVDNILCYTLIWLGSFFCLYRLGIISLVLSVDKSLHSEFVSAFLTKCHFRIFALSLFLPFVSFIFVIALNCLNLFKVSSYDKIKTIINNNTKSIAFTKWYIRVSVLFFTSIFYAIICVYGSHWGKPFSLLYTYKDCLVVLSSLFLFPVFNVGGRVIFSGAWISKSRNLETNFSTTKQLVKNFERHYSIYPKGSPQYRTFSQKAKLFSKLTLNRESNGIKSILEQIKSLKESNVALNAKLDTVVQQTSFQSGFKVGVATTVTIGVGADLILSKEPKTIQCVKTGLEFVRGGIKDTKISADETN